MKKNLGVLALVVMMALAFGAVSVLAAGSADKTAKKEQDLIKKLDRAAAEINREMSSRNPNQDRIDGLMGRFTNLVNEVRALHGWGPIEPTDPTIAAMLGQSQTSSLKGWSWDDDDIH